MPELRGPFTAVSRVYRREKERPDRAGGPASCRCRRCGGKALA